MAEIPMAFILAGLAAYTVLAGADFGAGLWTLLAGAGQAGRAAACDHARHAMGPVWEANHVWLILVLVVCWTAYPLAYASITSTPAVPLFIAAVGIILRGASYALRGQLDGARGQRTIENLFALSSVLTRGCSARYRACPRSGAGLSRATTRATHLPEPFWSRRVLARAAPRRRRPWRRTSVTDDDPVA